MFQNIRTRKYKGSNGRYTETKNILLKYFHWLSPGKCYLPLPWTDINASRRLRTDLVWPGKGDSMFSRQLFSRRSSLCPERRSVQFLGRKQHSDWICSFFNEEIKESAERTTDRSGRSIYNLYKLHKTQSADVCGTSRQTDNRSLSLVFRAIGAFDWPRNLLLLVWKLDLSVYLYINP